MRVCPLLPDCRGLREESVSVDRAQRLVTISVTSASASCNCPSCGHPSMRVHSSYLRKLADLPWHGSQVILRWRTRRFFCRNENCQQRIFAERLPQVASPGARRTCRMVSLGA